MDRIKTTNLKSLFELLITQFLIKKVGLREELQRVTIDYLQNILVGAAFDKFKSVALFQLLFDEGTWGGSSAALSHHHQQKTISAML